MIAALPLLFGPQEPTPPPVAAEAPSLLRTYKAGESDRYRIAMTLQGTVEYAAEARLVQTVKKIHGNGDADVENRVEDLKVIVMGDTLKPPKAKPVTVRTSRAGLPLEEKGAAGLQGVDLLRYVLVIPEEKLEIGKAVPVATDPKSPVLGVVRLEKVADGVAELRYDLTIDVKTPVRAVLRALRTVEVATGKTIRADGEITNLPQPPQGRLDAILFTFSRA